MREHSYLRDGNPLAGVPYRVTFYFWRHSPHWFRSLFYKNNVAKEAKTACRNLLARFAGRDDLYSNEYYVYVDAEASKSAPIIVSSILSRFDAKRIIDVGCGTGALLSEFRSMGAEVTGLEYSQAALRLCRKRGLDVHRFNIEDDRCPQLGEFDAAICFEVLNISPHSSQIAWFLYWFISLHGSFSPRRLRDRKAEPTTSMSSHEYWIEKFAHRGYQLLSVVTAEWRDRWNSAGISGFYARNIMVFEKSKRTHSALTG